MRDPSILSLGESSSLDVAYEVRDLDMPYLSVLDFSEELRADPRYLEMLDRLELPRRPS